METKETSREYYDKLRSYHNKEHYFKYIVDVKCNVVWLYDYINLDQFSNSYIFCAYSLGDGHFF